MQRNLLGWLLALLLCGVGSAQRSSEAAEWLFADPQEVVKTTTRTERTVYESFTTVRVLTRREIELSGAQTVQELLERMVADFQGQEASLHRFLSARGAYSSSEFNERVLFLLDGLPLNDALLGNFPATMISTHDVERVEVAFGPGSAMYGPNAFAGVVNIITAQENERPSLFNGYTGRGGYNASFRWANRSSKGTQWGVQASLWRDPGSDRVRNNDTVVRSIMLNTRLGSTESRSWRLYYAYLDGDRGSVGLRYGVYPTPYDRFIYRTHYWQVEQTAKSGSATQVVRFYGLTGEQDMLRSTPADNFGLGTRTAREFSQTMAGLEAYWRWDLPSASVLAGGDYRWSQARSAVHLGGSRSGTNLAVFLQGEWNLGRWHPILGARYDQHSIYGSQFSPRGGFTYQMNRTDILRASVGQAFRAPSFIEMYLQNFPLWMPVSTGSGWIPFQLDIIGNGSLKPERVTSLEVGWKHASPQGWSVDLCYFQQDVQDGISVFPMSNPTVRRYTNLYDFKICGWGAEFNAKLGNGWNLSAGYVSQRYTAQLQEDYKPPRESAVLRLAYWQERGLSGQIAFNYPAIGVGRTNAYAWNSMLSLVYRQDERTRWNLRIDNLFNTRTEMAWRVPAGSRSVWFTFQRDW
ncbi:MAG: TonB-dependent receptor [Fimbriimonadales bacterium]